MERRRALKYIFVVFIFYVLTLSTVDYSYACISFGLCNSAANGEIIGGCGPLEVCVPNQGSPEGTCVRDPVTCVACPGLIIGGVVNEAGLEQCGTTGGCNTGERCRLQVWANGDLPGPGYRCSTDATCTVPTCTTAGECCGQGLVCADDPIGGTLNCTAAACGQCGNPACGTCNIQGQCGTSAPTTQCNDGEVCDQGFCRNDPTLLAIHGCDTITCTPGTCGGQPGATNCPQGTICAGTGNLCITAPCGMCGRNCQDIIYSGPKVPIEDTITAAFRLLYPIAIGISLYLFATGLYDLMTSTGDPRKKQAAVEKLYRVITGTTFAIGSLTLLRLIIDTLVTTI